MASRGRHLVYRVVGIPVGGEAQEILQFAQKLGAPTPLRIALSEILGNQIRFNSLPSNDQAEEILKAAINFENLKKNGEQEFQTFVEIIPSCYDSRRRSALVYFAHDKLPSFLGYNRQSAPKQYPLEFGGADLTFGTDFLAMTQLYDPVGTITADIIAVPGLDGHAFGSWRAKDQTGRMWLRDFFRRDFPNCRTFTYGYNAKLNDPNVSGLEDYGHEFLEEIKKIRVTQEVRKQESRLNQSSVLIWYV
jgi:hypothetical protein